MRNRVALLVLASAAIAGGCTTAGSSPATAPTSPPAAAAATTTTAAQMDSTTISESPTTTIDRLLEIQAIFEDLERRRLQAIFDQNEEAFRSVYANDQYLERSLVLFDSVEFLDSPDMYPVRLIRVVLASEGCIAAEVETDLTGITVGGQVGSKTQVVEATGDGWGISYVGEDWSCVGPHPLS